jgi:hypothetical protein
MFGIVSSCAETARCSRGRSTASSRAHAGGPSNCLRIGAPANDRELFLAAASTMLLPTRHDLVLTTRAGHLAAPRRVALQLASEKLRVVDPVDDPFHGSGEVAR